MTSSPGTISAVPRHALRPRDGRARRVPSKSTVSAKTSLPPIRICQRSMKSVVMVSPTRRGRTRRFHRQQLLLVTGRCGSGARHGHDRTQWFAATPTRISSARNAMFTALPRDRKFSAAASTVRCAPSAATISMSRSPPATPPAVFTNTAERLCSGEGNRT